MSYRIEFTFNNIDDPLGMPGTTTATGPVSVLLVVRRLLSAGVDHIEIWKD